MRTSKMPRKTLRLVLLCCLAGIASGIPALPARAADAPPAPVDPCVAHADMICREAGDDRQACASARLVSRLLPPAACEAALADPARARMGLASIREACGPLQERLCADLGPASPACGRLADRMSGLQGSHCFLMSLDYETVLADLREDDSYERPLAPDVWTRVSAGGASLGPPDAKVTLVTFSDFECPHCATAARVASAMAAKYGNDVRIVFRNLPLPQHENAEAAALGALEATAQGRAWDFIGAVFARQDDLGRDGLLRRAAELGLHVDAFADAIDSRRHAAALDAEIALAREAGVTATPTVFVNGLRVEDPTEAASVASAIDAALAARAAGAPAPVAASR